MMKKLKSLRFGFSIFSAMFVASMLLMGCGEGDEEYQWTTDTTVKMVEIEGGTFTMGATSEQPFDSSTTPAHQVTLNDFSISETEVTQGLWHAVMGGFPDKSYPNKNYGYGNNYPMYYVSWDDIVGTDASDVGYIVNGVTYYKNGFCYRLSQLAGGDTDSGSGDSTGAKQFRLPTEAEWEYAARGGNKAVAQTLYSGSDNIDDVAWYGSNTSGKTCEVGKKSANALGLYDMSGNVWEWCSDRYGAYSGEAQTNPVGAASGTDRVLRGGSWYYSAFFCSVSCRFVMPASHRGDGNYGGFVDVDDGIGFRLAL